MQVICKGRRCGKTTDLINLAHDKTVYIVCADKNRVQYVNKLAKRLNKNILFPVTFGEYMNMRGFTRNVCFVFDDIIDIIMGSFLNNGNPILAISLTSGSESTDCNRINMTEADNQYLRNEIQYLHGIIKDKNDRIDELDNRIVELMMQLIKER